MKSVTEQLSAKMEDTWNCWDVETQQSVQ